MGLAFGGAMAYIPGMTFYHEQWPLFYEDNHLLVVYKPAGLVVQRDYKGGANLLDLAKSWIKQRYAKPGNVFVGMVHRLDGPVAGVMVLARTSKAASRLSAQFRDGTVDKRYLAVIGGAPPKPADRLTHWLMRDGRLSRVVHKPGPGIRQAILHYDVLSRRTDASLVAVHLETGRRHQIRAQLAGIGCPILGDRRYGAQQAMADGRIALLAHQIAFRHPTRGQRLEFTSPWPKGWPWPADHTEDLKPLWSIDDFYHHGLARQTLAAPPR